MKKIIFGVFIALGLTTFSFSECLWGFTQNRCISEWGAWDPNSKMCCDIPTCTMGTNPDWSCKIPWQEEKPCSWWIRLNTNVPFIWNCIMTKKWEGWSRVNETTTVSQETAFPYLISVLTKFLVWIIVLVAFSFIIVWGMKMTMEWASPWQYKSWKDMIIKAAVAIALLWMSWIILNAINPNIFKTQ